MPFWGDIGGGLEHGPEPADRQGDRCALVGVQLVQDVAHHVIRERVVLFDDPTCRQS